MREYVFHSQLKVTPKFLKLYSNLFVTMFCQNYFFVCVHQVFMIKCSFLSKYCEKFCLTYKMKLVSG